MKILIALIRCVGVLSGLFLGIVALGDVVGLLPYSEPPPLSPARLSSALPLLGAAAVLLLPQSRFLTGPGYRLLLGAHIAVSLAAMVLGILGLAAYADGGRHWLIVPVAMLVVLVPVANAFALWWRRRETRRT